jgi:hypothetical protein
MLNCAPAMNVVYFHNKHTLAKLAHVVRHVPEWFTKFCGELLGAAVVIRTEHR